MTNRAREKQRAIDALSLRISQVAGDEREQSPRAVRIARLRASLADTVDQHRRLKAVLAGQRADDTPVQVTVDDTTEISRLLAALADSEQELEAKKEELDLLRRAHAREVATAQTAIRQKEFFRHQEPTTFRKVLRRGTEDGKELLDVRIVRQPEPRQFVRETSPRLLEPKRRPKQQMVARDNERMRFSHEVPEFISRAVLANRVEPNRICRASSSAGSAN
jgi:hypothetical protein